MASEQERCCGNCREFKDGGCSWNVPVPVPFYMRLEMNLKAWSELKPTDGNSCPAFRPTEGTEAK